MSKIEMETSLNVFGEPLQECSGAPITGFFRDGHCNTCAEDIGSHTVCIKVTTEFLDYSRFKGNDLSTPMPEFGFPGLKEGDSWCLCANRWLEAYRDGMAPKVHLQKTHQRTLEVASLSLLRQFSIDLN